MDLSLRLDINLDIEVLVQMRVQISRAIVYFDYSYRECSSVGKCYASWPPPYVFLFAQFFLNLIGDIPWVVHQKTKSGLF